MHSSMWHLKSVSAVVVIIVLIFFAGVVQAQSTSAGDAAHFLRNGLGARARSMGGAFVAVANDSTATVWNSAGLAMQSGLRIGGSYENQFGGLVTSQYLTGTYGEDDWGTGALWFNSDLYSVYFVSAGMAVQSMSFGVSGKLYNFTYGAQTAGGLGVDVGVLLRSAVHNLNISLGLVSHDIGWTTIHWRGVGEEEEDNAAWVTRLGAAVAGGTDLVRLMGTADLELALPRPPRADDEAYLSQELQLTLDLGAEVAYQGLALRMGLADVSFTDTGGVQVHPTLGVGAQIMGIDVSAAWIPESLGATYLLSVEFTF